MKNIYAGLVILILLPFSLSAQQQVTVISRCGGSETITIPSIVDNDHDGMDDRLEQKLLNYFMPVIIQFDNETCPGPALDGTGDSNLLVCHIYPLPGQYSMGAISPDSIKIHPVAMVGDTGLVTGMIWYDPIIIVHCAVLYGQDCGTFGHTADVEGFSFTLKYTGPDTLAGWMYDTILQHWMGVTIQSVSHANTLCQQVETFPYKGALFPNGKDTVFASPNKHGNYLTIGQCDASIICNPGCNGIPSVKIVRIVNVGERGASLVPDLGAYYPAYAGEDPWSSAAFLASHSGNAGPVSDETARPLDAAFDKGQKLDTASQICDLYKHCYSCGDSIYNMCLVSGNNVVPGTAGFSPWYHCGGTLEGITSMPAEDEPGIYPQPARKEVYVIYQKASGDVTATIYDVKGMQLKKISLRPSSAAIDISELPTGLYILQLTSGNKVFNRKLVVE